MNKEREAILGEGFTSSLKAKSTTIKNHCDDALVDRKAKTIHAPDTLSRGYAFNVFQEVSTVLIIISSIHNDCILFLLE